MNLLIIGLGLMALCAVTIYIARRLVISGLAQEQAKRAENTLDQLKDASRPRSDAELDELFDANRKKYQ